MTISRKLTLVILIVCILALIIAVVILSSQKKSSFNESEWIKVTINDEDLKTLQAEVDNGHRVGLLDPNQVIYEFLDKTLNISGNDVKEISEEKGNYGEKFYLVALNDGRKIELRLIQPVKHGQSGIWVVTHYRFLSSK